MTEPESIDFSLIMASSVHDMKNSLAILMSAITAVAKKHPVQDDEDRRQQAVLQYEANRLNSSLVQLLGLYKLDQKQLPLNINYYNVEELLIEIAAQYEPLVVAKGISIIAEVEPDLEGCFDIDLIASVVNNILGNAIRYCKKSIHLNGFWDDGLVIEISDDGKGYPEKMLKEQHSFVQSIDYSTGSTGLGLYFAGQIARIHQSNNDTGSIRLSNGGDLGGGRFQLRLPG